MGEKFFFLKKSKLIQGTTVYTCQYFLNMDYCKKKK